MNRFLEEEEEFRGDEKLREDQTGLDCMQIRSTPSIDDVTNERIGSDFNLNRWDPLPEKVPVCQKDLMSLEAMRIQLVWCKQIHDRAILQLIRDLQRERLDVMGRLMFNLYQMCAESFFRGLPPSKVFNEPGSAMIVAVKYEDGDPISAKQVPHVVACAGLSMKGQAECRQMSLDCTRQPVAEERPVYLAPVARGSGLVRALCRSRWLTARDHFGAKTVVGYSKNPRALKARLALGYEAIEEGMYMLDLECQDLQDEIGGGMCQQ